MEVEGGNDKYGFELSISNANIHDNTSSLSLYLSLSLSLSLPLPLPGPTALTGYGSPAAFARRGGSSRAAAAAPRCSSAAALITASPGLPLEIDNIALTTTITTTTLLLFLHELTQTPAWLVISLRCAELVQRQPPADGCLDGAPQHLVPLGDDGGHGASSAGAPTSARSVQIIHWVEREVEEHDMANIRNVNASSG